MEFAAAPVRMALGRFVVGPVMGKGMQATVRRARDATTGEEVALRIINRHQLTSSKLVKLEREINVMKVVVHPNIIACRQVDMDVEWFRLNGTTKHVVLMVLDIAEHGELFDYLMHSGAFTDEITRTYMRQLMSALEFCHSQNIFHRDIKPENILLDSKFQLKLADFGLAAATDREGSLLQTDCGTKSYMAPEVLAAQEYRGADADVWSSAVVMFIMLCGNPPFQQANRYDWWFNAISLNRHDRFWAAHLRNAQHMAANLKAQDFLNRIFLKTPSDRMTLDGMKTHEWMQGVSLTPEELYSSMSRRREAVRQGQEREALEAANRAREAAVPAAVAPGAPVAVYRSVAAAPAPAPPAPSPAGASEVRRERSQASSSLVKSKKESSAVSKEMKESEKEVQSPTPAVNANVMYTNCRIEEIVERLTRAALSIDQNATSKALPHEEGFAKGLRINICRPADKLEFDGEVIEVPSIPVELDLRVLDWKPGGSMRQGVIAVEAVRLSGDIFSFQYILKALKHHVISHEEEPLVSSELDLVEDFGLVAQGLIDNLTVK
jgi:serine/threonine protein kinase